MSDIQEMQSALALSLRRRELEAALRGETAPLGLVPASQLILMRSLCTEMHVILDEITEEVLPMRFGRVLGELYMTLDRNSLARTD